MQKDNASVVLAVREDRKIRLKKEGEEIIMNKMLTPQEVKDILKVSMNYTYRLIKTDGFPTIKIGKRYFIPEKALEKWIDDYTFKEYYVENEALKIGSKIGGNRRKMRRVRLK